MSISLLLIDNYDSFTYNLYQAFLMLGAEVAVVRHDRPELGSDLNHEYQGIVISPGPGRPDDAGMSKEVIAAWRGRIPILGVCLGMQCINEVWGGTTVHAPVPVHGKTSLITHDGSLLYEGVPSPFEAARYHSLAISHVQGLTVTGWTEDRVPMSAAADDEKVWGIQYHPESFLTPHGPTIMANFLAQCRADRSRGDGERQANREAGA